MHLTQISCCHLYFFEITPNLCQAVNAKDKLYTQAYGLYSHLLIWIYTIQHYLLSDSDGSRVKFCCLSLASFTSSYIYFHYAKLWSLLRSYPNLCSLAHPIRSVILHSCSKSLTVTREHTVQNHHIYRLIANALDTANSFLVSIHQFILGTTTVISSSLDCDCTCSSCQSTVNNRTQV